MFVALPSDMSNYYNTMSRPANLSTKMVPGFVIVASSDCKVIQRVYAASAEVAEREAFYLGGTYPTAERISITECLVFEDDCNA